MQINARNFGETREKERFILSRFVLLSSPFLLLLLLSYEPASKLPVTQLRLCVVGTKL